eukprot:gene32304-41865_t
MIVGFSALLFKVICNATHFLNHDWFFSLEFSDVLVPFFVFCSCMIGLCLVGLAAFQCGIWTRASKRKLDELLVEFFEIKHLSLAMCFAPFYIVIDQMEFRIFKVIFSDLYHVPKLPFDDYVTTVFEKYIHSLIEIEPLDWVVLIALLVLTLSLRNWLGGLPGFGENCRTEDGLEDSCLAEKAVQLFAILGAVIVAAVTVLAVVTRHYIVSVLRGAQVEVSPSGYVDYLRNHVSEDESGAPLTMEDFNISVDKARDSLKKKLSVRIKSLLSSSPKKDSSPKKPTQYEKLASESADSESGVRPPSPAASASAEKKTLIRAGNKHQIDRIYKTSAPLAGVSPLADKLHPPGKSPANLTSPSESGPKKQASKNRLPHLVPAASLKNRSPSPPPLGRSDSDSALAGEDSSKSDEVFRRMEKSHFVARVFLCSSPDAYFHCVRILLVATAAYCALWFVNFASISAQEWKIITLLPGLTSTALFLFIVKNAALLKVGQVVSLLYTVVRSPSMSGGAGPFRVEEGTWRARLRYLSLSSGEAILSFDVEALMGVVEQAEDARQLGIDLRDKLLKKIQSENGGGGDLKEMLKDVFDKIDKDGSNKLSRAEFKVFMSNLGMTFTKKKWNKIFHEIDLNFDDEISFNEQSHGMASMASSTKPATVPQGEEKIAEEIEIL